MTGRRWVALIPIPVITLLLMSWDRMTHDVASSPEPWEWLLAHVVWLGSLIALVAVAVALGRRSAADENGPPLVIALLLGVVPGIYFAGVVGFGWPAWPELFNTDLETVGLTYLLSAIGLSMALYKFGRGVRVHSGTLAAAALAAAFLCGSVVVVTSWALVYFE